MGTVFFNYFLQKNDKTKGLKYFLKGILLSLSEILTRRTLGIIKHLIVS